jgi:hypothetical protein
MAANLPSKVKPEKVLVGLLLDAQSGYAISELCRSVQQIHRFNPGCPGQKIVQLRQGCHHVQTASPTGATVVLSVVTTGDHTNPV